MRILQQCSLLLFLLCLAEDAYIDTYLKLDNVLYIGMASGHAFFYRSLQETI